MKKEKRHFKRLLFNDDRIENRIDVQNNLNNYNIEDYKENLLTVPIPCFSILLISSLSVSKSGGLVNFSASLI